MKHDTDWLLSLIGAEGFESTINLSVFRVNNGVFVVALREICAKFYKKIIKACRFIFEEDL